MIFNIQVLTILYITDYGCTAGNVNSLCCNLKCGAKFRNHPFPSSLEFLPIQHSAKLALSFKHNKY